MTEWIEEADGVFRGGGVKGLALAGALLGFAEHETKPIKTYHTSPHRRGLGRQRRDDRLRPAPEEQEKLISNGRLVAGAFLDQFDLATYRNSYAAHIGEPVSGA